MSFSSNTATPVGGLSMAEKWQDEKWAEDIWYRGKVTRRTLVGWGGGAIRALMLVRAPWRAAFGAAQPFKIGSEQPLSGAGAAGGKTAVVGLQMAADRINASGGINGRPIELVIADDESSPAVARQKTAKMVQEDNIDIHVGGFLSNICIACMPVWEDAKIDLGVLPDRHAGDADVGQEAADMDVDIVLLHHLGGLLAGDGRRALVVGDHQLDRTAVDAS